MVSEYPAAIYNRESSGCVYGLIVELADTEGCFSVLDSYEGVGEQKKIDDEYERVLKPVTGDDSAGRMCWMYLYNRSVDGLKYIPSGNYVEYIHQ